MATFLLLLILGLTWKAMTKAAAIASMLGGFAASFFLLMFLHTPAFTPMGICKAMFGVDTLLAGYAHGSIGFNMQFLDHNIVAMPEALLIVLLVAMNTTKFETAHISPCWRFMGGK
ncbi:hypothetical protein DFAR_3150011 [Desulfarculales bacterium]